MANLPWTIGTAQGDVVANNLQDPLPTIQIGETIQPRFRFTPGAGVSDPETRWEALSPYVRAASEQTIRASRNADGEGYYREDTSGFDDVDSFLVSVEPPAKFSGSGVWGVITGGRDRSNSVRTVLRWDLDVVVLAPLGDYADRAAAETALKDEVR